MKNSNNNDKKNFTLDDFVGYDYIKEDIKEIIEILKEPKKYLQSNIELPKGLILSGRPGLGKTLLVKIISAQTGLQVFNISASEEKTSANKVCKQITQTFKKAMKHSPSIIVLDELDRMIPNDEFVSDKSRSILSTLLTNLDGFASDHANVFVIATTNGWGDIDDALKRSGRLDRRISITPPNTESREAICAYYLSKIPNNIMYGNNLAKQLAIKTTGFSCADIKKLINDSLIYCLRNDKTELVLEDFVTAIIKIKINDIPTPLKLEDKKIAAYHELGHLIVNYTLSDVLSDVMIKGFDDAGGANFIDELDVCSVQSCTKDTIANTAKGYLAGRAAEELFVGDVSYGYIDDLNTIRKMWCFCYGNGVFDISNCFAIDIQYVCDPDTYPARTSITGQKVTKYYNEFIDFIKTQYTASMQILIENKDLIEYLYNILMQKEFLCKEETRELIEKFKQEQKK